MRFFLAACGYVSIAFSLAACGGGGSSPSPSPTGTGTTAAPVLVAGTVDQYIGTDTIAHVYPMPTGSQTNYTAGYTFAETRSVNAAANGAPAAFDINTTTTFTTTQNPGYGIDKTTDVVDTFDNQSAVSGGTSLQTVGSNTTTTGIDETAGASGGGPYTQTVASSTTYAQPQISGVYPLVAGTAINEPIARTVTNTTTDQNGGTPETATVFDTSTNDTVNSDGSYTLDETLSNGQSETIVESSSGTGSVNSSGPLYSLSDTIGAPSNSGTAYTIPVTTYKQYATDGATPAPTATTLSYNAADWYPGGALPVLPFQVETITVKGGTTSLPPGCAGAVSEPNIVEVDELATTLNIDASYATTNQQRFDSNGTNVCVLRTITTNSYALTTGALSQTTTENYAQILTGVGTASKARAGSTILRR